ncbi:unnamed protein product, partial [marine sediment metagenome]
MPTPEIKKIMDYLKKEKDKKLAVTLKDLERGGKLKEIN